MYGRYQEEEQQCIFNLIPQPEKTVRKEKMYRSKYNPTAPVVGSTFGCKGTTRLAGSGVGNGRRDNRRPKIGAMGKALGTSKPDPSNYLRGGRQKAELPPAEPFSRQRQMRKGAVPRVTDRPVMGLQSTKNYVTANAVEAILAVPGNRARVNEQAPHYRHKVDYGRVPAYLGDVKEEIQRENEMIEQYLGNGPNNQMNDDGGEDLPDHETAALIDALKTKWGDTNAKYQKMCHMVKLDTIGKVRRKEKFETELTQLEKDIEKLTKRNVRVVDERQEYY